MMTEDMVDVISRKGFRWVHGVKKAKEQGRSANTVRAAVSHFKRINELI